MDEETRQKRQREFTIYLVLFILLVIVGKITLTGQQVGSESYNGTYNSPYGSGIYTSAYYNDPFYNGGPTHPAYGGYGGYHAYGMQMGYGYGPPQMGYGMGPPMQHAPMYGMNPYYANSYGYADPYQRNGYGGRPFDSYTQYGRAPEPHPFGYGARDPFYSGNHGWNGGYNPHANPAWNGGYSYGGSPAYGWSAQPQTAYQQWGGYPQPAYQPQGYELGWNGYYGGSPEWGGGSPHLQTNGWNYGYEVPMNRMGPNWW